MNDKNMKALISIENVLADLLTGKQCSRMEINSNIPELQNIIEHINHLIEDISDWKMNEQQLMVSAITDSMTGTFNRNVGLKELDKMLSSEKCLETHSIIFIDIDGLKTINDTFGHNEGDYTIKSIARILLSSVRETDLVCRYGGDEFLIILRNCSELSAEKMISRMQKKLKIMNQRYQKPYTLSFSYGITSFSPGSTSQVTDLIKMADHKMYQCKTRKREISNRFRLVHGKS